MGAGVLSSQMTALQKKQIYFSLTALCMTFLPSLPREVCQPSLLPVISDPQWTCFSRLEPTAQCRPERPQFDWKGKQPLLDSKRLKFSPGISCLQQSIMNQCPQCHLLNQKGTSTLEPLLLLHKGNHMDLWQPPTTRLGSRSLTGVATATLPSSALQEHWITFSSPNCKFPHLWDFSQKCNTICWLFKHTVASSSYFSTKQLALQLLHACKYLSALPHLAPKATSMTKQFPNISREMEVQICNAAFPNPQAFLNLQYFRSFSQAPNCWWQAIAWEPQQSC